MDSAQSEDVFDIF